MYQGRSDLGRDTGWHKGDGPFGRDLTRPFKDKYVVLGPTYRGGDPSEVVTGVQPSPCRNVKRNVLLEVRSHGLQRDPQSEEVTDDPGGTTSHFHVGGETGPTRRDPYHGLRLKIKTLFVERGVVNLPLPVKGSVHNDEGHYDRRADLSGNPVLTSAFPVEGEISRGRGLYTETTHRGGLEDTLY